MAEPVSDSLVLQTVQNGFIQRIRSNSYSIMFSDDHPIFELGEPDPVIFNQTDGDVLAKIDDDPEVEIPIFAYARENGSHTVFCFPDKGEAHIRVLFTTSKKDGDMKRMVDAIVKRFGMNELVFFNVMNTDLTDTLNGVSTYTKKVGGEKIVVGEVTWTNG